MRLIVAEKPDMGRKLADFLGGMKKENGYYIGETDIVSYAIGHLVESLSPNEYTEAWAGKWSLEQLPMIPADYRYTVKGDKMGQFLILKKLMLRPDVSEIVCGTDSAREGEHIFRLIYSLAGCHKPVKRLWLKSKEDSAIRKALDEMKDDSEYDNLAAAARCREHADWLVGMNFTRLYSAVYKAWPPLSCGRVRTPTLNLIVQRQHEIENFKTTKYYSITAELNELGLRLVSKVDTESDARAVVEKCTGKSFVVASFETSEGKSKPPRLYSTAGIEKDANRRFGYTAKQVDELLQKLYDNGWSTYPRVDSEYLTSDQKESTQQLVTQLLDLPVIREQLSEYDSAKANIQQVIKDAAVGDHHAILPTAQITSDSLASLPTPERNILFLIIYRLLTAAYTPERFRSFHLDAECEGVVFSQTSRVIDDLGWTEVSAGLAAAISQDDKTDDGDETDTEPATMTSMIQLTVGDQLQPDTIKYAAASTRPPRPYTDGTLISAMENVGAQMDEADMRKIMRTCGIGTPATRSSTIEELVKLGYIDRKKKALVPTDRGMYFIEICTPELKEARLTAQWELMLASIEAGEIDESEFMHTVTTWVSNTVRAIIDIQQETVNQAGSDDIIENPFGPKSIGKCPKCGRNVLERDKVFSCSGGKGVCDFAIWCKIKGKSISATVAKQILDRGRSDLIKGFTSAAGLKFDAYLILKEDHTIGFAFPKSTGSKGKKK